MPIYQLVCEGPCNPDLDYLDEELRIIAQHGQAMGLPRRVPRPDRVLRAMRKLAHTPHRVGGGLFGHSRLAVCEVCGTARQYG